jgi:hypothetical protein
MWVLGHIQCARLLGGGVSLVVEYPGETHVSHLEAFPSIFLLFLDSLLRWTWIASRSRSRQFSCICMRLLPLLHAHTVEQRGHGSIVAMIAPLPMSLLAGEILSSSYWYASGSVPRHRVPDTFLPNASQSWSSATPG